MFTYMLGKGRGRRINPTHWSFKSKTLHFKTALLELLGVVLQKSVIYLGS